MKGTISFFAFMLLFAIMLVMPPGRSDTNKEQPINTEFANIVQPDLNEVILYSPVVLEVVDNPSAICTGEQWVYTMTNQDKLNAEPIFEFEKFIYSDRTLLNDIKDGGQIIYEYGIIRTC